MATRRKRSLNFLPAEPRAEPVIDVGAYPVDIGVGELMRLTRERLGHELQSVANQLRIRLSYLEAIEESRFRDLPGTTYAVGFVRSYADYLGLDGADIVRRFREEAARIHGQTKLILPALTAEGKLPRAAVLLVSAVGLAVLYGAWYYRSSQQETEVPLITEVPDRLVALTPEEPGESDPAPVRPTESSPSASTTRPGATDPTASPATETGTTAAASAPELSAAAPSGTANAATPASSIDHPSASTAVPAEGAAATSASTPIPTVAAPDQPAPGAGDASATPDAPAPAAGSTVTVPDATGPGSTPAALPSTVETAPTPVEPASTAATVPATVESPSAATIPAVGDAPPTASTSTITVESIPPAPALPSPDAPETIQQAAVTAVSTGAVVLEARMDSWIKVVDAKGKTVTNRVLKSGERYEVPDQPGLILRTGNAGGLDVLVGDRKAPPLGDVGAVFQKIVLERDRLLNGTAVTD
jgi:cytoskeletal protein RodZ